MPKVMPYGLRKALPPHFLEHPLYPPTFFSESVAEPNSAITVVVPSYNQGEFLEQCLLSIINQGVPGTEIVLIDGMSTDDTHSVIKKYLPFIRYVVTEPDNGQSDALNKGFSLATGDLFGWLNADDLYLPGSFASALHYFNSSSEASVVFGDWLSVDVSLDLLDYNHAFDFNVRHLMYEGFHLNTQAMFWRRSHHEAMGSFDVGLHRTMDYQLLIALGLASAPHAFARTSRPYGVFRRHSRQKTGKRSSALLDEHRRIAQNYGFTDKYSATGRLKRFYYRLRRLYCYNMRGGPSNVARRLLRRPYRPDIQTLRSLLDS